jgi:hypothetical protein
VHHAREHVVDTGQLLVDEEKMRSRPGTVDSSDGSSLSLKMQATFPSLRMRSWRFR